MNVIKSEYDPEVSGTLSSSIAQICLTKSMLLISEFPPIL